MRLHEHSAQGCTTVDWMAFAAPLPVALVVPLQVAGIVLIATSGRVPNMHVKEVKAARAVKAGAME